MSIWPEMLWWLEKTTPNAAHNSGTCIVLNGGMQHSMFKTFYPDSWCNAGLSRDSSDHNSQLFVFKLRTS